jgi:hypothetical protein
MRVFQHKSGLDAVSFAPDGTLFVLARDSQLWAYPAGGEDRVFVVSARHTIRSNRFLSISPEGGWLSVSGGSHPVLVRVGAFDPPPGGDRKKGLGWQKETFPSETFDSQVLFSGDSAFCLGLVSGYSLEVPIRPDGVRLHPFLRPQVSTVRPNPWWFRRPPRRLGCGATGPPRLAR